MCNIKYLQLSKKSRTNTDVEPSYLSHCVMTQETRNIPVTPQTVICSVQTRQTEVTHSRSLFD